MSKFKTIIKLGYQSGRQDSNTYNQFTNEIHNMWLQKIFQVEDIFQSYKIHYSIEARVSQYVLLLFIVWYVILCYDNLYYINHLL